MPQLYRLNIIADEEDFPLAEALVSAAAESGWEEESLPTGELLLRVTCEEETSRDALAAQISGILPAVRMTCELIPDQDWQANWRSYFTPIRTGDFLILPPWLAKDAHTAEKDGLIPVVIEPKSAFGTGHHPTTTMCLDAIGQLKNAGKLTCGQSFLDIGTGTGILGIGCTKLGLTGTGVDIDPLSISNARENSIINNVPDDLFSVHQGSVELAEGQTFDVVIANILAGPLKELAPQILPLVRPGGCLILSGFLAVQVPGMLEAYASMGVPQQIRTASFASDPTRSASAEQPDADDWVCFFWPGN
jgi:ribosomal protein L11 methyltransferase